MSWLGIHLKGLRKHTGMSQEQLALRVGVGVTTIENIESGYIVAPPPSLVEKFANTYGVAVEELINSQPIENAAERTKEVYVVNEISADTALPSWKDVVDVIYVDRDILRGYDHIAVKVKDSSMLMEGIKCDSTAVVRLNVAVKNGDIVLAVYGNKSIVRKYYSDGRQILLRAANAMENYPDICLDAQKDKSNIIGKVVRCEFNV